MKATYIHFRGKSFHCENPVCTFVSPTSQHLTRTCEGVAVFVSPIQKIKHMMLILVSVLFSNLSATVVLFFSFRYYSAETLRQIFFSFFSTNEGAYRFALVCTLISMSCIVTQHIVTLPPAHPKSLMEATANENQTKVIKVYTKVYLDKMVYTCVAVFMSDQ